MACWPWPFSKGNGFINILVSGRLLFRHRHNPSFFKKTKKKLKLSIDTQRGRSVLHFRPLIHQQSTSTRHHGVQIESKFIRNNNDVLTLAYLLRICVPLNEKAENCQNEVPGVKYFFLSAATGAFIITAPGVLGVTIETDGNNPKKWPKTTHNAQKLKSSEKGPFIITTPGIFGVTIGLIYIFFRAVKGPFIITTPGIFGVTIGAEGNNPKKWRKSSPKAKKNVRDRHGQITPVSENGFSHSVGWPTSTPHDPGHLLQDSDEVQLRECLGLPARAWAVLGDIGPGRPTTQAVPNPKYNLKIAIIFAFVIAISK